MKAAVVGGGLAGLAAALDLADAGVEVTLHEARPTLGGAVQTLPEREGDPEPPPDNGQHIALGCFTEYLRFLERVGEGRSYLRTRLALPVLAEDGSRSDIKPSLPGAALVRARAAARPAPHPGRHRALPQREGRSRARRSATCCAGSARATRRSTASGTSSSGPALNLRDRRGRRRRRGSSPCAPRSSARAATPTSCCR